MRWLLAESGLRRIPQTQDRERTLNLLRNVPCWWTEGEQAQPLEGERPLLWDNPKDWPSWLDVDSLHPEFRKTIEEWEKQLGEKPADSFLLREKKRSWKKLVDNFLPQKEEHYLDWVLIPVVKKWSPQEWKQRGFDALKLLAHWEYQHNFDQIEPCVKGEEDRQNTLATALHLPTDKGWLPAIDCFAGKSWDGPEAFDEFFKDQNESGIVQSFEEWPDDLRETDQSKWKSLLRWIGVSWEPKVCQTLEAVSKTCPLR